MPNEAIDPIRLGLRVEQVARSYRAWRQAVRVDPTSALGQDPFAAARDVSSRAAYQSVLALPDAQPTREALARCVAALTLDRVTLEDLVEVEASRRAVAHVVPALGRRAWSVRDLGLESVLGTEPARRAAAAAGLCSAAEDASSNALFWLARRHEAARQLGLDSLASLEAPFAPDTSAGAAAGAVLEATDDVSAEALGAAPGWQEALARGAASGALEGWPARLSSRWLQDAVRHGGLLEGLRVDLGALPAARCGASFARALARLGSAVHRAACRASGAPFELSERPFDAAPACYAALLSGWLGQPLYWRRRHGLGRDAAQAQARALCASLLGALRLLAVQAAVGACAGADAAREAHTALGSRALGADLAPELAGVLPRFRPTAASRLAGALAAASRARSLVEEHDEDWFDNPRAMRALREIDPTERLVLDKASVEQGARDVRHRVGEVFER